MNTFHIISVVVSMIVMIACQFIDSKLNHNGSFSIPLTIMLVIVSLIPLFNLCSTAVYIAVLLSGLIYSGRFEINVNNIKFKK